MTDQLPQVFIGSSAERLDVAREIELQLQEEALTTIWKDGVFGLGNGTLESLMDALDEFDFAVMVLSSDDVLESRNTKYASPRDNVIFELGLFMGRLGRSRTFIVHEMGASLKLPSDLDGITASPYRERENLSAALSPTCTPIIKTIRQLGHLEEFASAKAGSTELEEYYVSQIRANFEKLYISLDNIMTFTQQISQKMIGAMDSIARMRAEHIPPEFSANGRLAYAQGIYSIARLATSPAGEGTHLMEAVKSLSEAQKHQPCEASMRLSQAYRQAGQLEKGRQVLKILENEGQHGHGRNKLMAAWSSALISLQEGLATGSRNIRRAAFLDARNLLQPIFEEKFGWDTGADVYDLIEAEINYGSIAYYTAKSMWAYRCTFPLSTEGEECKEVYSKEYSARLQRASDLALKFYDQGKKLSSSRFDDLFVQAIYEHCVAFIIAVRTALPEIDQTTVFSNEVQRGRDSLVSAQETAAKLMNYPDTMPRVVYIEGIEKLGSLQEFQRDNALVGEVFENPGVLVEFYCKGFEQ